LRVLVALTLLLTAADHWTTWLCLHRPVEGWLIEEANPLADWLFGWAGLVPGLVVDSGVTLAAVAFLATTTGFSKRTRCSLLASIGVATAYAVANNLHAIASLGISPLGLG